MSQMWKVFFHFVVSRFHCIYKANKYISTWFDLAFNFIVNIYSIATTSNNNCIEANDLFMDPPYRTSSQNKSEKISEEEMK